MEERIRERAWAHARDRLGQVALMASTLVFSWLGMQMVHEFGHVATAFVCGERVAGVVLHPLALSRTDVSHDRHPLLVVWGGPILGSAIPVGLLAAAKRLGWGLSYLVQAFAGFCLIANGAYLGVGLFDGVGDAGDLLRHGSPRWTLIGFGLIAAPAGLWLWNGNGRRFGFGEPSGRVDSRAVRWAIALAAVMVVVEIAAAPHLSP